MGKKKSGKIPDRWLDYCPLGQRIAGTKIVAFKVPLKQNLCKNHLPESDWFTPSMLLDMQPSLKTVIDLTNTHRYYDGEEEFGTKGIDHVKIMVEGRGTIPPHSQLLKFFDAMDAHMKKHSDDNDALVGVHCTHGLNRTGYFVCRWMVDSLKIDADDAIARFNIARGHDIERQTLLHDLRRRQNQSNPSILPPLHQHSNEYFSPLNDASYDEPTSSRRYCKTNYVRRNEERTRERSPKSSSTKDEGGRYQNFNRVSNTVNDGSGYSIAKDHNSKSGSKYSSGYERDNYSVRNGQSFNRDNKRISDADLNTNWRSRNTADDDTQRTGNSFKHFSTTRKHTSKNDKPSKR